MKDDFLWLQQWYQSHCNKDWKQRYKIHLGTIDNPGWSLTVDLEDTELEGKNFQQIKIDRSEQDWIFCTVRDAKKFDSACGIENLPEILKIFRYWATENEPSENNEYTWNDLVVIKSNAPPSYPLGKIAVVCGMEQVRSKKLSDEFNIKIGDWLYTVEFGDGSSIEIPEYYLEKY